MQEIISNPANPEALEAYWNDLAQHVQSPILSYEWFAACAKAFCPPMEFHVIAVMRNGSCAAIAPLTLKLHLGVKRLAILGSDFLGEPNGLVYSDETALEELVRAIAGLGKPVELARLPSDSREVAALSRLGKQYGVVIIRSGNSSPWIPIRMPWEEFESSLSSRRRSDLRRAYRRAEQLGSIGFEINRLSLDDVKPHLEEYCRVEAAGWKGKQGSCLAAKPDVERFFLLYSQMAAARKMLLVCFLKIGGVTAAVLIAVEQSNRFWVLKICYDETYQRCSPGILLTHETIRYAFTRQLESYEFLGNDERWLHMWTDHVHTYASLRFYPFTVAGLQALGSDVATVSVKRACKAAIAQKKAWSDKLISVVRHLRKAAGLTHEGL